MSSVQGHLQSLAGGEPCKEPGGAPPFSHITATSTFL